MCTFATANHAAFQIAMLRFVSAHAGLIEPQPGRTHFNLNARTCESPKASQAGACQPVGGDGLASASADRFSFDIDACFSIAPDLGLPERIVEVRK